MRQEFSRKTKAAAFIRACGRCERCTAKLVVGNIQYHHVHECTFGGGDNVENCACLCRTCHSILTKGLAKIVAKSNRVRDKNYRIKRSRMPMPGSRDSPWKKTFNYGWVRRI